jgi:hypothetical protein
MRKQNLAVYGALYKKVYGNDCHYCGAMAQCLDHVPALEYVERIGKTKKLWRLPACNECNLALRNRLLQTVSGRRAFLFRHYREKYRKALATKDWSETELREMSAKLQRDIRAHMFQKREITSRLHRLAGGDRETETYTTG